MYSILTPQIQDIHVHVMPETVLCLFQSTSLMVSHLLLLPWCTVITGYWISSNNNPTRAFQLSIVALSNLTRTRMKCEIKQFFVESSENGQLTNINEREE